MADLTTKELALELLRNERNILLEKTDKFILSDYPHNTDEIRQLWITYRQSLRDLTSNNTPSLSEEGELINITWPNDPNGNSGPDSLNN